jgi:hypothetical protein
MDQLYAYCFDGSFVAEWFLRFCLHSFNPPYINDTFMSIVRSMTMPSISPAILLKLPISVIQWADMSSLQPARDAVKMKRVLKSHLISHIYGLSRDMTHIANAPGDCTLFASG